MAGGLPRRQLSALVAAGVLLASCSAEERPGSSPSSRTRRPGTSPIDVISLEGRIAFGAGHNAIESAEIYAMAADGSGLRRLTDNDVADFDPAWSPDGSRIVFRSQRDGNDEIYVMNGDGSHPRNISNHPAVDWGPHWSPDGRWIAFNSGRDDEMHLRGFVTDPDGQSLRSLGDVFFEYPAWSPDGRSIAFMHQTFEAPVATTTSM